MTRRIPPAIENVLRHAGLLVLALSLPFILVFMLLRLGLSYIAPGFFARRDMARREYLDQVRAWQRDQLSLLRTKPYQELVSMPEKTELLPPPPFKKEHLAIVRAPGESGGVQIGVAHFHRFLFITSAMMPSFEMLPDGSIVEEPSREPDD